MNICSLVEGVPAINTTVSTQSLSDDSVLYGLGKR
jgi:hypothetical protein